MNRIRTSAVAVAAVLAVVGASAQAVSAEPANGHRHFTKADLGDHGLDGLHFTPASQSNKVISVMLEMAGQPVAVQQVDAEKSGKSFDHRNENAARAQLKQKQDQIKPQITKSGAHIVAQLQTAYNGIQVQAHQKDVAQLATLPGVVDVHQMRTFKPANVNGVPYIGGPDTWGTYDQTGKGVKVAIIDTGIDYTHADFGGPGTVAAFKQAAADSTTAANSEWFGSAAPKVKGGYDFVGDDYDADTPGSVPKPDPNPLDCNGHGTHTGGTAAGFGVTNEGKTYGGTYDVNTIPSHKWNVGPGVAPEADIYAYRIFGCEGSSDVVAEAIDRAVKDNVDVISMSLGSDLGGVDDPTTVAAENAAAAGISVVAASGNAGQNAYMTSSPASGDHVLSVAALDGSLKEYPGATLAFAKGGSVNTINANGAELPTGSLPVKVLRNADGSISLGCDPSEYTGVAGAVVVTARGTCARVARAVFGQQAGAAAVVMLNSDASLPPYEGPITSNPDTGEPADVSIPFLGAAGTAENETALSAADGDTVTLTASTVPNSAYSHAASFTSGGPRNADSAPKPEVIAPGVSVASAGVGTGDGYVVESGTSMATPMTAGTAALVKGAHPDWNGDQIKAAIQNTADPSLNADYDVRVAGTGAVQAQKAVDSSVLAQTKDGLNSLAFGFVPGSRDYKDTKTFTLTNTGTAAATYDLTVEKNGEQLGAKVALSADTVTVRAGKTANVKVTLTMSAPAFASLPSDDTFEVGVGQVLDLAGAVVATPVKPTSDQQTLRMAYLMVPRGLSNVTAGQPSKFTPAGNGSFTSKLSVTNTGIHDGTADVYAWGIADGKDNGGSSLDIRAAGVQSFPDGGDSTLVFAVNNWGAATNHSVDEFDVAIDNNRDGEPDYFVVGIDLGAVLTGAFDGRFASVTIDAKTGAVVDAFIADAPMNGSTVKLPALASELGVTAKNARFDYTVTGFSVMDSALADPTSWASFDAFSPAVNNGQLEPVPSRGSAAITLSLNRDAQQSLRGTLGWLVVSLDDASGAAQADEVRAPSNMGGGGKGH